MQKVVHVSLHGNAFTLEEEGHAALQAYLDEAAQRLAADPDREEILGDLEQAIAEKCARCIGPGKDVVTAAEVARVIAAMGPVSAPPQGDGTAPAPGDAAPPATPSEPPPRRLYRILEEGVLGGLCAGIGAYLRVDANVVRAGFVILTLVTHGAWLLVYLVLLFVIPAAGTAEERAAARGLPFSAQELIDQAKRQVARLERGLRGPWAKARSEWRRERAEWRRERRERRQEWREWRDAWRPPPAAGAPAPATYGEQVAAGIVLPFLAMFSAALTVGWAVASARLVGSGDLWGWNPGLPLWAALLLLLVAVAIVGGPVRHARHALHRDAWGRGALLAAWDGLLWLGFVAVFAWLAWRLSPELRTLVHDLPGAAARIRASLPSTAH